MLDTGRLGALGQDLADQLGPIDTLLAGGLTGHFVINGRSRYQGVPLGIVNDLGVDVRQAAEHVQARPLGCATHFAAHTVVAMLSCLIA